MLSYNQQYNIINGVFLTFSKNANLPINSVNHSDTTRQKYINVLPHKKYSNYTKDKLVLVMVYIMFNKTPSSINVVYTELHNINFDDIKVFHNHLVNYKLFIDKDIELLKVQYGKPSSKQVIHEYINNNIKFYTVWWYLKYTNNLESSMRNPINKVLLQNIQQLLLYIKFSESVVSNISILLKDNLLSKS